MTLLRSFAMLMSVVVVGVLAQQTVSAQQTTMSHGSFDFNNEGVIFQNSDSTTRVVMRFRMQNWAVYNTPTMAEDDDLQLDSGNWEFAVRRLRLRFGGSIIDPRLTFNLQLSFSRGDMDWRDTQFPNVIRDAMIFWSFNPNLQIGFGQTKLPGNRQRVISSGDIEIADRSIVNGAFNIDRDFGFQGFWRPLTGDQILNLRAAISSGDGRNQTLDAGSLNPGSGLAYTGRAEFLPFGAFKNGGDYFEGDLVHEQTPKLSVGVTYHYNDRQIKTRGTLGTNLFEYRSSTVLYADALFKYDGLSIYTEYGQRACTDEAGPITTNGTSKAAVFVGNGFLIQPSYVFPSMWSIAARYAVVDADDALAGMKEYQKATNIGANVGYYINKHRVKLNLEFGTNRTENHNDNDALSYSYYSRFNMELGI